MIEHTFHKSISDKSTSLAAVLNRAAAGLFMLPAGADVSVRDLTTTQYLLVP